MRLVLALVACLACANTASAQYTAQALPPPPELSADATTRAFALNNHGQVFGIAFGSATIRIPVLWTDGIPQRLPIPDGYAWDDTPGRHFLNDAGTVVSSVVSPGGRFGITSSVIVWQNGVPSIVAMPEPPANRPCNQELGSLAFGLNRAGHVFGVTRGYESAANSAQPCGQWWIFDGTQFTELADPVGGTELCHFTWGASGGLNPLNDADHLAIVRVPLALNALTNCDPFPQFAGIDAAGVFTPISTALPIQLNNHDQMLLFAPGSPGILKIATAGRVVDIGPGAFASLNNLGVVAYLDPAASFSLRLWKNGVVTSPMVPAEAAGLSGPTLANGMVMNDAGQIAASPASFYSPTTGYLPEQIVLLTPLAGASADTTSPLLLNVPGTVTADTFSNTAAVTWPAILADDDRDGPVPVTCTPAAGSAFPVGTTHVTCSATDSSGNTASAAFDVTVQQTVSGESTGWPGATTFRGIGDLPGGPSLSLVRDATRVGDTLYAVGGSAANAQILCTTPNNPVGCIPQFSPDTAVLWASTDTSDALTPLPNLVNPATPGINSVVAAAITRDAAYIATQARSNPDIPAQAVAARVTRSDFSILNLSGAPFPALAPPAGAQAISDDGAVVYGGAGTPSRVTRFDVATSSSAAIPLLLSSDTANMVAARGASADGSVAVGTSFTAPFTGTNGRAFRYLRSDAVGTVSAIPLLPGGTWNKAIAVSSDGRLTLVVGDSTYLPNGEVYVYDATAGTVAAFGSPNTPWTPGNLGGITADGSVAAVTLSGANASRYSYIHNVHGWFRLTRALASQGLDIAAQGWALATLQISGISPDGTLVFGSGEHNGSLEGFVAEFPAGYLAGFDVPAVPPTDTSIVGAWHPNDSPDPDSESVLALMADGTFYEIEAAGFERGRYSWDSATGAIQFTVLHDTNGDAGMSDVDGLRGPTAVVAGDTLTLVIGTSTDTGTRIAGGQHSIVGGWMYGDPRTDDDSGVIVFLPDGTYVLAEDRVPAPSEREGVEVGSYTWDAVTGSFAVTSIVDTDGEAGLTPGAGVGQTAILQPSVDGLRLGDDSKFLTRIVDPNRVVPAVTSPLTATGKVGVPFAYTVAATWAGTFGAAGLPGGLVLDTTTGIVSGTPTASGDFTVTISAANSFALTGSAVLTMTIAPSLSATLLNVSNASTVFGGATVLSATLTSGGVPVAGQMVSFQVNGVAVGVAATNGSGTATLGGVTLAGIPAGTYAAGVQATYAGDATHAGASGAAALSVAKATPVITWPAPASLAHGTPLSGTQLNATASVAGTFVYTPATGTTLPIGDAQVLSTAFTPADAANYTTASAQVTIDVVDTAPIARNGAISTLEDTAVSGSLSATDPDGDPVTFQIVAQPTRGTVVLTNPATGAFTYTPAANRSGGDSFTFQATDGVLTSNVATVTVDVAPVNDPPVAQNIVVTTEEGTAGTGLLVALDADGDPLTFSVVTPPANGTVTIADPATGAFAYTPNGGAFGYDPFTFRVTDAAGASSTATGMPFIVANSPRWPGQTVRASVSSAGTEGNRPQNPSVSRPALSGDGRFVAFQSVASNLVSGDTNDREDVFVRDRATGQTTRVSVSSTGTEGNDFSGGPTISQDGRIVAFTSNASNLVDGDTNNAFDAFVYDRQTGQTTRVSVSSTGAQGNGDSFASGSSADGRFVAFTSMASNLVSGDTNAHRDVFVHDRETGQTTRVSVSSSGVQGDSDSFAGIASADGRFVAFFSTASNLVPDDTNGTTDVFVHDVQTGQTSRVSVSSGGAQANGFSFSPAISADGRFVAFTSDASDLAAGDATGTDIFVHDRRTGQTSLVSADRTGVGGALFSDGAALSADGRFVSFFSFAPLTSDDSNVHEDVFIRDRLTGETRRVSVGNDGAQGNGDSVEQSLSADGRFVAFASIASNLVSGDTNLTYDTFVVGGVSIAPATVSVPAGGGSRTVDVAFAYPGTPWTAATAEPWIALTPAAGAANGTVDLSVAPNYGPARSGTVVAALQTIGVSQDAFVDVTPPIVTAPAPITVYATQLGGTTPGTSAVGVFLAAATAVDDGPAAPVQLSPMLNGAPVTTATLFALGANTVTFTFVDAAGHAATATSVVTVTGGRPSLAVRFVGTIEASVNQHATLRVTNTGAGPALKVNASLSSIRTLAGSGTVTLASGLPAGVPTGAPPASRFILPGESYDIPIGLNVPFSVSRFVLSEALTMTDSTGTPLTSTAAQTVFPAPDTTPPTITVGPAIRVTSSSATITWTTSEPASSRVDWGTGTNTNRIVPEDSVYATNHSVTITGLLPNTLYSFIVSGHDQAGNGYASSRRTARTNP